MDVPTEAPTAAPPVAPPDQPTQAAAIILASNMDTLPGDPAAGDVLFHTFQPGAGIACTGCHRVDSDDRLIGPGLKSIGIRAQTRVPGLSAQDYIRTSIIHPSAFVVEGYPDLMPKNWGVVF
jgi:cytochrome c2